MYVIWLVSKLCANIRLHLLYMTNNEMKRHVLLYLTCIGLRPMLMKINNISSYTKRWKKMRHALQSLVYEEDIND